VLAALRQNVVFFFTPTQVAANEAPRGRAFRVGGLVERNSVERQPDGITVHFIVTDTTTRIPVIYTGVLPDLFRDGKGVVTQGRMGPDGIFHASQVLAKHDENYMPPEAAHAITKARSADSHALPFTASQTTP
jgi:cytochrome c-type biogenesis protein CcmE